MNVTELSRGALVQRISVHYRRPVMKLSLATSVLALLLLSACGDEGRAPGQAGSDSKFVGGPCLNDTECEFTLCESSFLTPGGTCTSSCSQESHCSSGASCAATVNGWYCLVNCTSDADCRTNYFCQEVAKAPPPAEGQEPSLVNVCLGGF